nr:HNH/ENDO VII family nuclease [Priestia megaterium]
MGQSLATKGTEKLNNMRNTLRTSAVANVTKQAYQSVKNAPASWTQSLHKTYNNILDSSMPRLMPDLVPVGPALAQQTVREALQNVKQQTMQMVTKVKYDPNHNSYRGPDGRFMSESDVTKMGDEVEVETLRKVDKLVKVEPEIQKVTDEVVKNGNVSKEPYSSSRPSYGKGQVEQVWENAKDPINGKIYDSSGVEIGWDKSKPRNGQWDMGHIPGEKYSDIHELYMNGTITKKEFLEWYRDPANYRPELPSTNRGHEYE